MIQLKGISKVYKTKNYETIALGDVNIDIKKGEFVAVCGASGTGKSTLLNIIGFMNKPSSGKYYFEGNEVNYSHDKSMEENRKNKISFIFQNFALMDKYTLYENIEMPLIAKNIKRKERRKLIEESVELVNLREPLNKFPSEISGGQQQRVAIARALAMRNPTILADEPTGALDEKNSEDLMDIFKLLKDKGSTIIMVTHNMKMAEYADRIIQIEKITTR